MNAGLEAKPSSVCKKKIKKIKISLLNEDAALLVQLIANLWVEAKLALKYLS